MAGVHLATYLRQTAPLPFVWGERDCCLWAADWIMAARGLDPAAPLRGRYRTAIGAGRHIRRAGGFVPLCASLMRAAGLPETPCPQFGDVAAVQGPNGPVIAIRTTIGYATKTPAGICCARWPMLMAWSV